MCIYACGCVLKRLPAYPRWIISFTMSSREKSLSYHKELRLSTCDKELRLSTFDKELRLCAVRSGLRITSCLGLERRVKVKSDGAADPTKTKPR